MRQLVMLIILAMGLAGSFPGLARADGIKETISRQIEAFRRDDAETAFSFASPSIQQQFGTPDVFMSMVARGYPQVYRPRSFRFAERATRGRLTLQKVIVVGPDGVAVAALYEMVKIDDRWRINGCRIAKLPGQDV